MGKAGFSSWDISPTSAGIFLKLRKKQLPVTRWYMWRTSQYLSL